MFCNFTDKLSLDDWVFNAGCEPSWPDFIIKSRRSRTHLVGLIHRNRGHIRKYAVRVSVFRESSLEQIIWLINECCQCLLWFLLSSWFISSILIFNRSKLCLGFLSQCISTLRMRLCIVKGGPEWAIHWSNIILSDPRLWEVFKDSLVFIPEKHHYLAKSLLLFNFICFYFFICNKRLVVRVLISRMSDLCNLRLDVRFFDFWNVHCFKLVHWGLFIFIVLWYEKLIRFAKQILSHFKHFGWLMDWRIYVAVEVLPPFSIWCRIKILWQVFSMNYKRYVPKFWHVFSYHSCLSFLSNLPLGFLLFMLIRLS